MLQNKGEKRHITVAEMIALLQKCPADAPVWMALDPWAHSPVTGVLFETGKSVLIIPDESYL